MNKRLLWLIVIIILLLSSFNVILQIKHDEFEKEKVARNMFQMVKENEVIYKYVEKNNIKTEKTEEEK